MYKQKGFNAGNESEPAPSKEAYEKNKMERQRLKSMLTRPGMSEEAVSKTKQELASLPKYKSYVVGKEGKK